MANKILVAADANSLVWADTAGDYGDSPFAGTEQITLNTLAAGNARQGSKADIDNGLVEDRFARRYTVTMRIEFGTAPTAGGTVDLYWAPSLSSTAGTANPGGTNGTDAAYSGTGGSTLAQSLLQLEFLGQLVVTNDAAGTVLQTAFNVTLPLQHGMPVVVNNTDQSFDTDDINQSITFTPIEDEIQ